MQFIQWSLTDTLDNMLIPAICHQNFLIGHALNLNKCKTAPQHELYPCLYNVQRQRQFHTWKHCLQSPPLFSLQDNYLGHFGGGTKGQNWRLHYSLSATGLAETDP